MAQRIITLTFCDPCGTVGNETEAGERISITMNGKDYEADLCAKHFRDLHKKAEALLEGLVAVKRKVASKRPPANARARKGVSSNEIREWARENGISVPDRGRIPGLVMEAYNQSGG